jgi:esterase/lipase
MPGTRPAVLGLHGFTGAPFELRPLADALGEHGWQVEVPTLATAASPVETLGSPGGPAPEPVA